jgi:hypothetical protein
VSAIGRDVHVPDVDLRFGVVGHAGHFGAVAAGELTGSLAISECRAM